MRPGDEAPWHGGFESWEAYFAAYRAKQNAAKEPQAIEEEPIKVLVAAEVMEKPESAPGKPGQLAKRLLEKSYEVTAKRSLVRIPAVLYKSDSGGGAETGDDGNEQHSAGDVRYAAHNLETFTLFGVWRGPKKEQLVALDATWMRKHPDTEPPLKHKPGPVSFSGARTYDPIFGYSIRLGATKARKRNATEEQEGIEPPKGFNEWFDDFCPKPAPKSKTKATN